MPHAPRLEFQHHARTVLLLDSFQGACTRQGSGSPSRATEILGTLRGHSG